jgi:Tfp pilus assembly protein PilZ
LVDYEINNLLRQDFIRDISNVGVFIETPTSPPVGEKIRLSFSLTDAKKPIRLTGRIVRSTAKGFAVAFQPENGSK